MIDSLALRMAEGIKNAVPDHPASVGRLKYSLTFILNAVFIITLAVMVSLVTHKVFEAATVLFAFGLLRQVSGGIHLKSGTLCVVVSVSGVTALSFFSFQDSILVNLLTGISVIIMLLFAPSGIENQTRIQKKYYPVLKVLAVLIVSSNFYIGSSIIACTFIVQAVTLILRREVKSNEEKTNV
ncbi:MAG: accessory gene regulator ArgB-like protein [Bacillota bacterium]